MVKVPVIPSCGERANIFQRDRFSYVDDIARKGWLRTDRLLNASRQDTLNFQVKLHARSVIATRGWFCAPLVYQIESIELDGEAWRVLSILEIRVRLCLIAFHYPAKYMHISRQHLCCLRKLRSYTSMILLKRRCRFCIVDVDGLWLAYNNYS